MLWVGGCDGVCMRDEREREEISVRVRLISCRNEKNGPLRPEVRVVETNFGGKRF
jgi:hypothetical protein